MQLATQNRLLAAGCSYTFYIWPTWADYLGRHHTHFQNKGIPGGDNATIARIVTSMAEPNDTVAIMWTAYQRHNYNISFRDTYNGGSVHRGTVNIKDKYYFTNIFNSYERLLTTLDYIEWVIADSVARNYQVYHFSAFNFLHGEVQSILTDDMRQIIKEKQWVIDQLHPLSLQEFSINDERLDNDSHPTKDSHFRFYQDVVCKKLNLDPILKSDL